MVELIALYIVCRNIGDVARSAGLIARPHQVRAVLLWFAFEIVAGMIGFALGFEGAPLYVLAFLAALSSLHFSFSATRRAAATARRTRAALSRAAARMDPLTTGEGTPNDTRGRTSFRVKS